MEGKWVKNVCKVVSLMSGYGIKIKEGSENKEAEGQ